MLLYEVFLIGVGLSMDAFAAAVCRGLAMKKINYTHALIIGLFFGGFQALMPLIGWLLGRQFADYIEKFDHWIAFALLAFIGVKMAIESFKNEEDPCDCCNERLDLKELFVLAVATSIDALAVGITFALYPDVSIVPAVSIIGIVTFVICAVGVLIGHKCGSRFKSKAELAGGIVLVAIGIKLLVEGLIE